MPRPRNPSVHGLVLLPFVALLLSACGDSAGVVDDPLAGLDELAIYAAVAERVGPAGLLSHTTEANGNLRQAVGWPYGPFEAGMFGTTLIYVPQAGWTAASDRPPVATDVARVVWYQLSSGSVALPLVERGHVDLTDRGDPAGAHLRVRIVDGSARTLADYGLRVTRVESGTARTDEFVVDGPVGDGTRSMQVSLTDRESVASATGDRTSAQTLELTEAGFRYMAVLSADSAAATGASTARVTGVITLDGVTTRLELDVAEGSTGTVSGTGHVTHAGVRIADVEVAGAGLDMTFTRPGGGAFTAAQQSRLGTLVSVLLMPVLSVQTYFS
jgi:hypothetical protein